jgi:hypothetical protein
MNLIVLVPTAPLVGLLVVATVRVIVAAANLRFLIKLEKHFARANN